VSEKKSNNEKKLSRSQLRALETARKGLLVTHTLRAEPGKTATFADFGLPELTDLAQPGEIFALQGSTHWEELDPESRGVPEGLAVGPEKGRVVEPLENTMIGAADGFFDIHETGNPFGRAAR